MRIRFERFGGLVPSLTRISCEVNVDALPEERASEIRSLLQSVESEIHPTTTAPGRARDQFEYEIEVEDEEGSERNAIIGLADSTLTAAQCALVNWLVEQHTAGGDR